MSRRRVAWANSTEPVCRSRTESASPPRNVWGRVVLRVNDVDAMYRLLTAGFDPSTSPADAPWGERYFHIHDPDGHELSFARPLAR